MKHFRAYKPRLYIASDHAPYYSEVALQLSIIGATQTGRTVFSTISSGRHDVRIMVFQNASLQAEAFSNDKDYPDSLEQGAHSYDTLNVGTKEENYRAHITVPMQMNVGTGRGANTTIAYHPAGFRQQAKHHAREVGPNPADVVLLHELVHAIRGSAGIQNHRSIYHDLAMRNYEEFCALMVENTYRSERGLDLRRRYLDKQRVTEGRTDTDFAFYREYASDIDHWLDVQPVFFNAMATVPATFNPFRAALLTRAGAKAKAMLQPFARLVRR